MAVEPFSPADAKAAHQASIPDEIINAVNRLLTIAGASGSRRILITQREVLAAVEGTYSADRIFANNWLDFEPLYRNKGWKVKYDKPGYNESYDAFWTFTPT